MKIKQLRLKDFGCFNSNRDFDFSDDLVIISGENYSGKATIARAIYFLLADKVLTTGMKPKDIRAAGKGISTVGLIYENENHVYRTYRSTEGDIRNEIRERESWRSMDSTEPPLPKLNPEQWRIGCFLKEEELGEFLMRSPGNRRDLLNQILGVEQLLRAEETFIEARRISKRKAKLALSVQSGLRLDAFEDREADLEHCRRRIAVLRQKLAEPADMDSKHYLFKE